jgi:hypothetical protein
VLLAVTSLKAHGIWFARRELEYDKAKIQWIEIRNHQKDYQKIRIYMNSMELILRQK